MKHQNTDRIDSAIRGQIQRELPQCPQNPWFRNKVMNRLPARRSRFASIVEWAFYVVGGLALIGGWWSAINAMITQGPTPSTLVLSLLPFAITLSAIAIIAIPMVRRSAHSL